MRRLLSIVLVIAGGCASDNSMIEILYAAAPDNECSYPKEPDALTQGFLDPSLRPSYPLALRLANNLQPPTQQPTEVYENEVRNQNNDITVIGMDTCWFLQDSDVGNFGEMEDGFVDCDELPEDQRGFAPTTGLVPQNGGTSTVVADVLSLEALEADGIFGPIVGADPLSFSRRNAGLVVLQVRVIGVVSSGTVLTSGWFIFPIAVEVHGLQHLAAETCGPGEVLCISTCLVGAFRQGSCADACN